MVVYSEESTAFCDLKRLLLEKGDYKRLGSFNDNNALQLKDVNNQYEKWIELYDYAADVFIPCCKSAINFKASKSNPKWFNPTLKKLT